MPGLSNTSEKELLPDWLKHVVRRVAPWYGAFMSVYAPVRVLYSWLHGTADVLKVPLQDLVFNILVAVGIMTGMDIVFGLLAGLTAFHAVRLGGMSERPSERVGLVFGTIIVIGLTGWMLFYLVSDPLGNDFATTPKWSDGGQWFFAVVGIAVLILAYVFFGKRLLKELKSLKGELEKQT